MTDYDEAYGPFEGIRGDHIHHGFYEPGSAAAPDSDHRLAQIRMIEESLRFAGVSDEEDKKPKRAVDVGCGLGGSTRYLASKYGASCVGFTISPLHVQRAQALTASQGLSDKVSFQVADALDQPFPDGQFDLVLSMDSAQCIPNKKMLVSEMARVAAPGGTIIIVTCCHRDLAPSEKSLKPEEKALLDKLATAFFLSDWCSTADYVQLFESLSLQDIKVADWTEYVTPFWPAMVRHALTFKGFISLLRTGWTTIRGALGMPSMIREYKTGLVKYCIITCRKP